MWIRTIPATNPPTITGRTQVGETLEVSTTGIADADGIENATFEYQWIRHDLTASTDENIDGATGATYTVEAADEGEGIKVRVSFTDDAGNEEELTSAATGAIQPVNTPATGAPSINGVPRVGVTLAVTTTGIADADGIENATLNATFEYQWVRHDLTASTDENIDGATGSTYTVEAADEGKGIKVRVSFTDDRDNEEELTSNTVLFLSLPPIDSPGKSRGTPVTKTPSKNNPATNPPTITGRTQVGETLEVSTTGIADADGIENATFEYQWVRHDLAASTDENIGGATGATYTVEAADEGKGIKVRVSFTDDRDNEEELTSAATGAVQPELTSSYKHEPTSHDGSTPFTFEVEFTEDPRDDFSYKTMRDHAFTMSGGTVIKARRLVPPGNMEWEITVQPDGDGAVTITLPATTDCAATGAICTEDGGKLSNRMVLTVAAVASQEDPVTEDPVTEDPVTATVLTSSYGESPASHDGSTPFTFEVEFTEDPEDDFSYKTMRDHAFTVSGGTVIKARRLVPPGNVEWEITVQPDGNGAVTITLPATTDCAATGAICTEDGTKLSNRMALTVPGPGRS